MNKYGFLITGCFFRECYFPARLSLFEATQVKIKAVLTKTINLTTRCIGDILEKNISARQSPLQTEGQETPEK
jgi:hypothetical protein